MIREPVVAGQFYPARKDELEREIRGCFLSKLGPGKLPGKRDKKIKGIISPHAGYVYSGPCAAHGYKEIGESEIPNTYIILGPSHIGFHKTCFSEDDWHTPLGLVKSNTKLGLILEENGIDIVPFPHKEEHSIEVQLPFLQFVTKDNYDKLKFMPIIVAEDFDEVIDKLKKAVKVYESENKKAVIIASSDFSHVGPNYGYIPFRNNIKENMYKLDKEAINFILNLNSKGFLRYCDEKDATICGKYPIAALIEIMKEKKAKPELLKYYTSGDITGDYTNAVGYGSIVFR